MIRIGCSGWNYRDWRGAFYPDRLPARRWLEAYAERFDTVEVNTTFYRLPKRDAVEGWVRQTPDGFGFAVKASRYLTHIRRLRDIADGVARFRERVEPLADADRLIATLWQVPANFHRDDDRLAAAIDQMGPGRHAFEARHPSWYCDEVAALLRERDVAFVVADDKRRPLPDPPRDGVVVLHPPALRPSRAARELQPEGARRLGAAHPRTRRRRLVYFNNDWEAFAPRNAEDLRRRLSGRS